MKSSLTISISMINTKREPPDMMSASEGGRGSWESRCSKGGCENFMVQIRSKSRCGEGGQKSENFADLLSGSSKSARQHRHSMKGRKKDLRIFKRVKL